MIGDVGVGQVVKSRCVLRQRFCRQTDQKLALKIERLLARRSRGLKEIKSLRNCPIFLPKQRKNEDSTTKKNILLLTSRNKIRVLKRSHREQMGQNG